MIREILIKILFRLLDNDKWPEEFDQKRINSWLVRQYSDMGFREYFKKRDVQMLKTMGTGLGRSSYKIWLGQRFELLNLLQKVGAAYKATNPKTGADVRNTNKKISNGKKAE